MTAQQTYDVITLPGGGWATGNWRDNFGGVPKFDVYETDFGTGLNNSIGNFPQQTNTQNRLDLFGFPGGLAGKYMGMGMNNPPLWAGALGNLIGAGINLFKRK